MKLDKMPYLMMIIAFIWGCQGAQAELTVGQSAPDYTLTDTHGAQHSLSDYQGKYVVMEWVNHDCPFVVKQYKTGAMQSLQKDSTEKGVAWLSIGSSAEGKQGYYSTGTWNELTQNKGASPTAVLLDSHGKVGKKYGAKTTPHMFIVDPEGKLIYQGAIDDTPSADSADVPGENYVRSALDQHMAGQEVATPATKAYGCSVKY